MQPGTQGEGAIDSGKVPSDGVSRVTTVFNTPGVFVLADSTHRCAIYFNRAARIRDNERPMTLLSPFIGFFSSLFFFLTKAGILPLLFTPIRQEIIDLFSHRN